MRAVTPHRSRTPRTPQHVGQWPSSRKQPIASARHTTAMHLLQARIDVNSIALWLGQVNPSRTHAYVEADLAMKERTLHKLAPTSAPSRRFRADDRLLAFLNGP